MHHVRGNLIFLSPKAPGQKITKIWSKVRDEGKKRGHPRVENKNGKKQTHPANPGTDPCKVDRGHIASTMSPEKIQHSFATHAALQEEVNQVRLTSEVGPKQSRFLSVTRLRVSAKFAQSCNADDTAWTTSWTYLTYLKGSGTTKGFCFTVFTEFCGFTWCGITQSSDFVMEKIVPTWPTRLSWFSWKVFCW